MGEIIVSIVAFNFTVHEIEPTPPIIQQDFRLMIGWIILNKMIEINS